MDRDKAIMDVLSEIVKQIVAIDDMKEAEMQLVETLVKKGYRLDEISDILEKVFHMINQGAGKDLKLRMIHPMELEHLTDDAKKLILSLRSEGILEENVFEEIMGFASAVAGKVDVEWIKNILDTKGIPTKKIIN